MQTSEESKLAVSHIPYQNKQSVNAMPPYVIFIFMTHDYMLASYEEFVCVTVSGELPTNVRILLRTLFFEGIMQSMWWRETRPLESTQNSEYPSRITLKRKEDSNVTF